MIQLVASCIDATSTDNIWKVKVFTLSDRIFRSATLIQERLESMERGEWECVDSSSRILSLRRISGLPDIRSQDRFYVEIPDTDEIEERIPEPTIPAVEVGKSSKKRKTSTSK